MGDYAFHHPWWFLALALVPLVIWLRTRRSMGVLLIPFAATWHRPSLAAPSRLPAGLAVFGAILLIVALARPQRIDDRREVTSQGYDIMLSIDLSASMWAEDYKDESGVPINRLQAVKPVIQAFITQRPNDRIGIVVFSGRAYTLAPLTFDHDWLERQVERLRLGIIEDGTAIGDGLGVALTRLERAARESSLQRKGAFVVLLTDGANNRGSMTPEQSTAIAKSRGVPVHTILAGKDGLVPFPVFDNEGRRIGTRRQISDFDEGTLITMARETGGRYFRADDEKTVAGAFKAIDETQKIDFKAKSFLVSSELFFWFAAPGLLCLFVGAIAARPRSASRKETAAAGPRGKPAFAGAAAPLRP